MNPVITIGYTKSGKAVRWLLLAPAAFMLFLLSCKKNSNTNNIPSHIESIALLVDYEAGYGGYIYPVHNPYVFFRNGVVVKEPLIPANELPTEGLSKEIAQNWGVWEQNGDKVNITWQKGSTSGKEWPGAKSIPAAANEKLQGSFSSFAGGGNLAVGGTVGVLSYSNMSFTSDGWFASKKVAGGGDASHTVYSETNTAGRYVIDGYGITLTFNSGDVKRLFFCFYGEDKTVFRLAGRTYTD